MSDQNVIGRKDGTITRARGIARTTPDKHWQKDRIRCTTSTPTNEHADNLDSSEEDPHAQEILAEDDEDDDDRLAKDLRRLRITQQDLKTQRYTTHCPSCNMYRLNHIGRAQSYPTPKHVELGCTNSRA